MLSGSFHGSDTELIAEKYGIKKDNIVSFASNVNPLGISEYVKRKIAGNPECIEHYPERDYLSLRKALSGYINADVKNIMVANGSSELIAAFIRHFDKPVSLIVSPAYSEYERNVKLAGGSVDYIRLKEEDDFNFNKEDIINSLNENTDLLIICNPVNPTSTALNAEDLKDILKKAEECGIYTLVDETYMEFADRDIYPAVSLTSEFKRLFIIRSMSKFFSAPGLRVGYAVCSDDELRNDILYGLTPWSVSSFAESAAIYLLSDKEHIAESESFIKSERARVCSLLDEIGAYGLKYYKPCANFILCCLTGDNKTSGELFEYCIKRGLLIRDCNGYGGLDNRFFRFCMQKSPLNDRLLSTIEEYLKV
ncbi:MAG: aminotransferase class I/II-fold pyridoxal phosphate-dependent enzyme [Lachnospiraceae bacterium]|nr:aminotransferase class I/II-fold pyridoxal phosphate-dependent enzyme [Lachnospiraceae bacterium]